MSNELRIRSQSEWPRKRGEEDNLLNDSRRAIIWTSVELDESSAVAGRGDVFQRKIIVFEIDKVYKEV